MAEMTFKKPPLEAANAVQRKSGAVLQDNRSAGTGTAQLMDNRAPVQRNNTGLPDKLKSGVENLSGMSMDHVRVHYNSPKPAALQAHAYAQGSNIHLGPGQEKHLPHEAWHVVQQAQGRVKPTMQMKAGVAVNDDVGLEREADVMGGKALQNGSKAVQLVGNQSNRITPLVPRQDKTIQRMGSYIPGADGPYAAQGNNLATAGAGFTPVAINAIYTANGLGLAGAAVNAPQIDDQTGNRLVRNYANVAAVDHIYPAGLGGSNAYRNAQVLDAHTNSGIGNLYPKFAYNGARVYMGHAAIATVPDNVNAGGALVHVNIAQGRIFPVAGAGAGAQINMSTELAATVGIPAATTVSPAKGREWGILPGGIPDPL